MSSFEKKYENLLNKNEADSYFEYASAHGIRTNDKLNDSVVKANTERAFSSSDYGAKAERLSSLGLNASGYEDYLKSQTNKRYSESKENAELTGLINEYKNQKGYQDYLSEYEALQTQISESVIKKIGSGNNFSFENAFDTAIKAGVSKNLAYATAAAGVEKAITNAVNKAIQFAKVNHLSAKQAQKYATDLGLDEFYSKRVYDEISALTDKEKNFYANLTAGDYYNYLQSQAQ